MHGKTLLLAIALVLGAVRPAFAAGAPSVSPGPALLALKDGNSRYVENRARNAGGGDGDLRLRLAREGQRPIAAVIACADSRVPVEALFDQELGGLFVIRAAGNTADIQSLGSVQYAVEHLDIPLVVVLGHTRCGAVRAVLAGERADACLGRMLAPVQAAVRQAADADVCGRASEAAATEANVRLAMRTLSAGVRELAKRQSEGRTLVFGALYDIETGVVEWLDSEGYL